MNTLSKAITAQWFQSEGDYEALRAWWKAKVDNGPTGSADMMLYMTLLGRDWRKAFTPITNTVKLENGQRPHSGACGALSVVRSLFRWYASDDPRSQNWVKTSPLYQWWSDCPIPIERIAIAASYIASHGTSVDNAYVPRPMVTTYKVVVEEPVYQEVQIVS